MALIGSLAINMKLQTSGFSKGLAASNKMLHSFSASVVQTGASLKGLFAGAAVAGGVAGFRKMVMGASDLNEAMSKTSATFGSDSSVVIKAADDMASAFGTSKTQFLEATSTMGGMFEGAGMSSKRAADLSVQFGKLAMDVKSFNNLKPEEAFEKLRAGLTGESEPLKSIGVLMNENLVKSKALSLGFREQGGQLSELAKVEARAAIIMEQTSRMQGDMAKTAGGVANASTGLAGRIGNISDALGTVFLPLTQQALGSLNRFATGIYDFVSTGRTSLASFVDSVAAGWDTFTTGIGAVVGRLGDLSTTSSGVASVVTSGLQWIGSVVDGVGLAWRNLPLIIDVAALQWQEKISNMIAIAQTIPGNLMNVGTWIATNWRTLIVDAVVGVGTAFMNLSTNLANLGVAIVKFIKDPTGGFSFDWTPLLKDFKAATQTLPEIIKPSLVSLQDEIDAKLSQIGKAELARSTRLAESAAERAKLAADAIAAPSKMTKAAEAAPKLEAPKFASATTLGSKEAANAILRSRYGAGVGKGAQEQTASNTKKTVEVLQKIAAKLGGEVGAAGANPVLFAGNF